MIKPNPTSMNSIGGKQVPNDISTEEMNCYGGQDNNGHIKGTGSTYLSGMNNQIIKSKTDDNWDAESQESEPDDFKDCEEREEFVFENRAKYKGQWKGNARHGLGNQVWPDGAKYEGHWKNNKAHGQGVFWHVNGDKYEGDWKRDKAHGYGKYTHSNKATYDGEWRNDLQHGRGI